MWTDTDKAKFLSIHYTHFHSTHPKYDEPGLMRNLQNGHIRDRKYGDIAYHYLVGVSGKIYEGRPLNVAPASGTYYHSEKEMVDATYGSDGRLTSLIPGRIPGNTEGHITVSFNYGKNNFRTFPDNSMRKSATFIAKVLVENNLKPSDIRAHREVANSDCPGEFVYKWLRGSDMNRNGKGPGMKLIENEFARISK